METWILIVFLASGKSSEAGISGLQAGLFASAAECQSAAKPAVASAKDVASGYANAVCVQTTHRSYLK